MMNNRQPFERKYKITHVIADMYDLYKKDHEEKDKPYVSKKDFVRICHLHNQIISREIIENYLDYRIGWRMGYMRIKKSLLKYKIKNGRLKPSTKIIDWGACRKLWKEKYPDIDPKDYKNIPDKPLIFFTNEHSNGEVMKWHWDKSLCNIKNNTCYLFTPTKYNRRTLAKVIKEQNAGEGYRLTVKNLIA